MKLDQSNLSPKKQRTLGLSVIAILAICFFIAGHAGSSTPAEQASTVTQTSGTAVVAPVSCDKQGDLQMGSGSSCDKPGQTARPPQPAPAPSTPPHAPAPTPPPPPQQPSVPAEYKSALSKATSYSSTMSMSKQGVYDQLTSDYGEKFSAAAAQYAIDNVKADWNANALAKAKEYQQQQSMSPAAIHDQLVSSYGEKFTATEADYAIQHLN